MIQELAIKLAKETDPRTIAQDLRAFGLKVIAACKRKRPITPNPTVKKSDRPRLRGQTLKLLQHLQTYGSITNIAAEDVIGSHNVKARAHELRAAGYDVLPAKCVSPGVYRYSLRIGPSKQE